MEIKRSDLVDEVRKMIALAARLVASFEAAGASRIEPGYLQPADVLLDLRIFGRGPTPPMIRFMASKCCALTSRFRLCAPIWRSGASLRAIPMRGLFGGVRTTGPL